MSMIGGIGIDGKATIGNALAIKNLKVPFYQRSYAWKEKHVLEFFQDLQNAIQAKAPEYFLGSIVVTQENTTEPENVVDGQQRIAWQSFGFCSANSTGQYSTFEGPRPRPSS